MAMSIRFFESLFVPSGLYVARKDDDVKLIRTGHSYEAATYGNGKTKAR